MPLDRVEPNAQGRIERTRLVMQVPTQALWKRQYPLAQRYRRQHMIREVGRGHGHAARVAGRADAATIAQQRNQEVVAGVNEAVERADQALDVGHRRTDGARRRVPRLHLRLAQNVRCAFV